MKRITVAEASEHLDALLEEGTQGEDILITGRDGATYRLVVERVTPVPHARTPDLHAGLIRIADDFDAELPDSFWLDGATG